MSTECTNCGNERIMLCPFCEHDFSESSKQKDAELTRLRTALAESEAMRGRQMKTIDEMRGTIRVLGKECRATRLERERFFDKSSHAEWAESVRLAGEAIMSTNADPAARAAVEGA